MINAAILRWARESSYLSVEAAAAASHVSRPEKWSAVEAGREKLTFRQAERFAHYVRLPMRTFYVSEPPAEESLPRDFRSRADEEAAPIRDFAVIRTLREIRTKRDAALRIMTELHISRPPLPAAETDSALAIVSTLEPLVCAARWASELRIEARHSGSARGLSHTKEVVEREHRVLVFESSEARFRGCALWSLQLPVVVLSSQDTPNARRFTLTHELAHLLLRQSGFCDPASWRNEQIERLCDEIAGRALVPSMLLSELLASVRARSAARKVEAIAREFIVSHSAAAVRLWQAKEISQDLLRRLLSDYREYWLQQVARRRGSDGGPHPHATQVRRLGPTFTDSVLRALDRDILSISKAATLLGVRPSHANIESIREKYAEAYA